MPRTRAGPARPAWFRAGSPEAERPERAALGRFVPAIPSHQETACFAVPGGGRGRASPARDCAAYPRGCAQPCLAATAAPAAPAAAQESAREWDPWVESWLNSLAVPPQEQVGEWPRPSTRRRARGRYSACLQGSRHHRIRNTLNFDKLVQGGGGFHSAMTCTSSAHSCSGPPTTALARTVMLELPWTARNV